MSDTYRRIVLASRPNGWVVPENFRIETLPIPSPGPDEVLVRNHYLSLDPYMRGRMNEGKSYAKPQELGTTMIGATVGEVAASRHPAFPVGSHVRGMLGWSEYGVADGRTLERIDTRKIPISAYLGVVGMPGMTAWYGYHKILAPKPGETLVVSAASGAVGSVVGQLAKLAGARAVGIAGGAEKCRYVTDELGFDACVDYRAASDAKALAKSLRAAAPNGVDAHFENVGGDVLNAVMGSLNTFARVAICGLISDYNNEAGAAAASAIRNPAVFLVARIKMQGFIVSDHLDLWPQGLTELGGLFGAGKLKYRESVAQGLGEAPQAFIGLLHGRNFGKQIVRLI
ncbi:MAG: NADP-dependent oxidoreductase [Steroidobacteraceae bacterium]|jgi:NADPH-dependent curcumin reductase CurA